MTPAPDARQQGAGHLPSAADLRAEGEGTMAPAPGSPVNPRDVIRLYVTFNRRLTRIVRASVLAPEAVIEDACQVAWTALICQDHVDRGSASAWLVRTAVREALRLMRLQGREDSLEWTLEQHALRLAAATDTIPEEVIAHRERLHGMRLLSARQQRLVWLRALGFSHQEMAEYERCTGRTVRRQLERARTCLRRLQSDGEVHRAAA